MSPSRWISKTNSIGFISKRGKYGGGTFAHPDIALEFVKLNNTARRELLILSNDKNIVGINEMNYLSELKAKNECDKY